MANVGVMAAASLGRGAGRAASGVQRGRPVGGAHGGRKRREGCHERRRGAGWPSLPAFLHGCQRLWLPLGKEKPKHWVG